MNSTESIFISDRFCCVYDTDLSKKRWSFAQLYEMMVSTLTYLKGLNVLFIIVTEEIS